jgi:hypothetical protein
MALFFRSGDFGRAAPRVLRKPGTAVDAAPLRPHPPGVAPLSLVVQACSTFPCRTDQPIHKTTPTANSGIPTTQRPCSGLLRPPAVFIEKKQTACSKKVSKVSLPGRSAALPGIPAHHIWAHQPSPHAPQPPSPR